jgi:hypothetical protein
MILIIAVLAIFLLIACVALWSSYQERNMLKQQLRDEQEAKAKLLPKDESKETEIESTLLATITLRGPIRTV